MVPKDEGKNNHQYNFGWLARYRKSLMEFLRHMLTSQEREELESWLQESPGNRASMEKIIQGEELISDVYISLGGNDEAIIRTVA